MKGILFRVFGVVGLLSAGVLLVAIYANAEARKRGGPDLSPLLCPAIAEILIGVGLLFLRKWAAVLFAAPLAILGCWLFFGSLMHVQWPWALINIVFSLVLLFPTLVTVTMWKELR